MSSPNLEVASGVRMAMLDELFQILPAVDNLVPLEVMVGAIFLRSVKYEIIPDCSWVVLGP